METAEVLEKVIWGIDPPHSEIGFIVKHLMITNVKGYFREFETEIYSEDENFKDPKIAIRIKADSIDTGDAQRDGHLRSADFFDVEHHPLITFHSTAFEKARHKDTYLLTGELEMRGVTRPVRLDVVFEGMMKDPWGNRKAGFTITGKISRKDWGLYWNAALESGGVLVSDEVRIQCEVQLVMK